MKRPVPTCRFSQTSLYVLSHPNKSLLSLFSQSVPGLALLTTSPYSRSPLNQSLVCVSLQPSPYSRSPPNLSLVCVSSKPSTYSCSSPNLSLVCVSSKPSPYSRSPPNLSLVCVSLQQVHTLALMPTCPWSASPNNHSLLSVILETCRSGEWWHLLTPF